MQPRLHGRDRDRQRTQVRPVRPGHRPPPATGAPGPAPRNSRPARRAWQRARTARSPGGRRHGAQPGRRRCDLHRRLPVACLRIAAARTTGPRLDPASPARCQPYAVVRGGAGHPRIRAWLDHGRQRLHQAAGGSLSRRAGRQAGHAGLAQRRTDDAVQRRPRPPAPGAPQSDRTAGIRTCRRGDRRRPLRRLRPAAGPAGLRHGRHHRQADPGGRRRAVHRPQFRSGAAQTFRRRQRPAHRHHHGSPDRDRRRRGQHRASGRTATAQGRPLERGLRAGPCLLCAGWRGAHGHRRQPAAGIPQPRLFRRRLAAHRQGPGAHGRPDPRPAAGPGNRGRCLGRPRHRGREHGGRGAGAPGRMRPRRRRFRVVVHGRRRTAARLLRRAKDRRAVHHLPAGRRRGLRLRLADRPRARRSLAHRQLPARNRVAGRPGTGVRRAGSPGARAPGAGTGPLRPHRDRAPRRRPLHRPGLQSVGPATRGPL